MGITQLLRVIYLLRLGAGLAERIGLLYRRIGALLFGVLGLPSGVLGERVGARRAMLCGAGVLVLGLCLLPITELLTGPVRAIWPIVPELVNTLGWSLLVVNSVPILVATTAPEDRKTAYALREALLGVAVLAPSAGRCWLECCRRPSRFTPRGGRHNGHARALSFRIAGERRPEFRRAILALTHRLSALRTSYEDRIVGVRRRAQPGPSSCCSSAAF